MIGGKPIVRGRFNYINFKGGFFSVIFVPKYEGTYTVIAENLSREQSIDLVSDLNGALNDTKLEIWEMLPDIPATDSPEAGPAGSGPRPSQDERTEAGTG